MLRAAALALLFAAAYAAQPSTPEQPPGANPGLWLLWGNDWFAAPPGPDDNRTNELEAGCRAGSWAVVVDDSMLTHLYRLPHASDRLGLRVDEVTATVWRDLGCGLSAGAGWRYRGDAGGQGMQDWWHRASGSGGQVHASYERPGGSPCAGLDGRWQAGCLDAALGVVATADGQVSSDVALRAVAEAGGATLWVGPRWQYRRAGASGRVERFVAGYEDGMWVEAGLSLGGGLSLMTQYSPRHHQGTGAVVFTFPW